MPSHDEPKTRICTRLFTADLEKIKHMAQTTGTTKDFIIRAAIRSFVRQLSGLERRHLDGVDPVGELAAGPIELELDLEEEPV